ncbi:hypothetical protein [Bradyrhizobium sp. 21]|uniref:hypothetical protein n=1 Tax=Bradyrhizobium sp. 21 TaxID=2782666 RepID=UPI001FF6FE1E|nr:hypothetical protein [Bradyrhizobium sp. 21]MCK1388178.1 hypothetical protein [Bradyrhizobium sp. 21]
MATSKEKAPFSPKTERVLTLVQMLFPILATIGGALWAINGYFNDQDQSRSQAEASRTARINDARKPFYELQLKIYGSAATVAGALASEDPASDKWMDARRKFYALYWSELSMVEDSNVKSRMVNLEKALVNFNRDSSQRKQLQDQCYCLATALKESIASNWTIDLQGSSAVSAPAGLTPSKSYCDLPVHTTEGKGQAGLHPVNETR